MARARKQLRIVGLLLALVLVVGACGRSSDEASSPEGDTAGSQARAASATSVTSKTKAADVRAQLTGLLTEHVYLAALATGAGLRGDEEGFNTFATALNGPASSNTADLVALVSSAYGPEVGKAFDGLWRSEGHIPAFVAYTQAVAAGDKAGQDEAAQDLLAYAKTFGETMSSVNENLPADAVEKAVTTHVTTLKEVVDAQKAQDQPRVYSALRTAYAHMGETAAVLAGATAKKFAAAIPGDPDSKASAFRATLTLLLREHVFLAASATGGALGGRQEQFQAAAAALNGPTESNTADIVAGVGSVYGAEVGQAFDGLWRSEGHIPGFVAYTQAVAAGDKAAQDKAVAALVAYAKTFGQTMSSVNENLPADAVEQAVVEHISTLGAVIRAQKAGDVEVANLLRKAAAHMSMTAGLIAEATVQKFPDKF